jgi:hypothetical protein
MDMQYFDSTQRDYAKIWVHPWSGISVTNSTIPEPKGKTRKLIIEGLLTIFNSWKAQLDKRDQAYYLKIWLYEPHITRSQVVCARGDMLNFYDNTFSKGQATKELNTQHYGLLSTQMEGLNWALHKEEFHFSQEDIGEPEEYMTLTDYQENKRYLERLMKHRRIKMHTTENNGEQSTLYAHQIGNVWIGGV